MKTFGVGNFVRLICSHDNMGQLLISITTRELPFHSLPFYYNFAIKYLITDLC